MPNMRRHGWVGLSMSSASLYSCLVRMRSTEGQARHGEVLTLFWYLLVHGWSKCLNYYHYRIKNSDVDYLKIWWWHLYEWINLNLGSFIATIAIPIYLRSDLSSTFPFKSFLYSWEPLYHILFNALFKVFANLSIFWTLLVPLNL